jgi:hypothetical protein
VQARQKLVTRVWPVVPCDPVRAEFEADAEVLERAQSRVWISSCHPNVQPPTARPS